MSGLTATFHPESPIAQVSPDLVMGRIRWNRALGLPGGDLRHAFVIECHHTNLAVRGTQRTDHYDQLEPHAVDAWIGPHDSEHYQISFVTDARFPNGFGDAVPPPKYHNVLSVSFQAETIWENVPHTLSGVKVITPQEIAFNPPGKPQVLADILVIKLVNLHFRH
jgi:hypothetical protein